MVGVLFFARPTAHAAWYTTGGTWNYRQKITINHLKVPNADQANFPVLIKITDQNNTVFTKAKADGSDIIFVASDETTKLSYEIEKFSTSSNNKELDAWVKISSLSHTADTTIYMYYGNSTATAPAASVAQDVWSNGYAGVWHATNASTTTIADSVSTNTGTKKAVGEPVEVDGKIGLAQNYDGVNDYITGVGTALGNAGNNANITLSGWVNLDNVSGVRSIFNKGQNGSCFNYGVRITNGILKATNSTNDFQVNDTAITTGGWHYVSIVYNSSGAIGYVDNTVGTLNTSAKTTTCVINNWVMGVRVYNDLTAGLFDGSIDEFRIANSTRSADWIATEYANQNDPASFFSLDAEAIGDQIASSNPTTIGSYSTSNKTVPLASDTYYNYPTPYFEWSGAGDTGNTYVSGVAGYYSYFGTTCDSDPDQSRGILSDTGGGLHYSTSANITIPDLGTNDGTYCLRIKTQDNAGNISATTWQAFTYKYDQTTPAAPTYITVNPSGYSSVDSFEFSWPVVVDTAGSTLAGYQYKRGNGTDAWSATITANSIADIVSYQTSDNIFLVRSIDVAGNTSASVQTTYNFSNASPVKPTGLTATPSISDVNSFAFSWTAPVHTRPIVDYGYSLNAAPTLTNLHWTGSDSTTLAADHFASRQGVNTLYLVAKDDSGAYALAEANYALVDFNCTTAAPPIPATVSISDSSDQVLARYMLTLQWMAGSTGSPQAGDGQDIATFDHYSVERSIDGVSYAEIATIPSTAYIDASGLDSATEYYYQIRAVDNAGAASAASTVVSKIPTGKFTTPPTIAKEPTVSAQSTTATLVWAVNRVTSGSVRYGTTQGSLGDSRLDPIVATEHTIILTGLQPGKTYYYQVQSLDALREYTLESAYSTTYSFTTKAAPLIANVLVSSISLTSADVSWETTSASNTKVHLGTSLSYGTILPENDTSMTTRHSVKLTKLADTTKYHFKILGLDIDGNLLSSDDYVFETLQMPTIFAIEAKPDFSGATPIITVTWSSNVPISSGIDYTPKSAGDTVTFSQSQSLMTLTHQVILGNLLDITDYQFTLSGADQFGNKAVSDLQVVKTVADTRPPQITNINIESSNVGTGSINEAKIVVSWVTDEMASSQVAYNTGLNGVDYEQKTSPDTSLTQNHMVIVSGLKPGAPYHLQVLSADQIGNLAKSPDQAVVTGQVAASVFSIISQTMNNLFGWIGLKI